ncbi:MAG: glutamine--fructose-6-phosphate transaminase (isomerizing) [Puniceicoccales bacterium]|jgi:glucosamine--fructose-6-phosphate aminotransferase (isomerizing)|nr:glutamine--fructose-6-phosphate transaminase (isomerizing) [Puniceicoccales bacterium]
MCGIIGYVGQKQAETILVDGLKRLEYRGYDSAGITILEDGNLCTVKCVGKVNELAQKVRNDFPHSGTIGIGHTRWATHGNVSEKNAHPHFSDGGNFAIVHNGIIENYLHIKAFLTEKQYHFYSETDSEVLANLIDYHHKKEPFLSFSVILQKSLLHVEGTYGIAAIGKMFPDEIVVARKSSPLLIGLGDGENIIASDVSAVARYTKRVVYLNDGEIASVRPDNFSVTTSYEGTVNTVCHELDWEIRDTELGDYTHYMQKEIFEQPISIENAMRGRFTEDGSSTKFGGLPLSPQEVHAIERLLFCACGTAYHACLVGKYLIEKYARIPVDVEYASEFRYRNAPLQSNTLVFVVSQSGETIDTLAALEEARRKGYPVMGITNTVGSTIARATDGGIYQHAGLEVGVASTKAFTSQLTILSMLALFFARGRDMDDFAGQQYVHALKSLPGTINETLKLDAQIRSIAEQYCNYERFLFLGRQAMYPIAMEGALKLKEITYVHGEAFPTAEMKHGPIALISDQSVCIFIATQRELAEKTMSNIQEVKARGAKVIAIVNDESPIWESSCDEIIRIAGGCHPGINPIISVIPLQLFAYHMAVLRNCDVDRPRNLAKSVTVE